MSAETTTLTTPRLGEITVSPDAVVEFPRGLLGFEAYTHYALITSEECEPFAYLQSLDDPKLLFIVINPRALVPHYRIEVDPREIVELEVSDVRHLAVWAIVTVPEDMTRMSVNLQGPLLISRDTKRGKQLVLVHSTYTTCHYIMDELQKRGAKVCVAEGETVTV
ncbi:MAG: flagellar assembly protein FliW [Candidatus Zixiibacteriota bacterium]